MSKSTDYQLCAEIRCQGNKNKTKQTNKNKKKTKNKKTKTKTKTKQKQKQNKAKQPASMALGHLTTAVSEQLYQTRLKPCKGLK